MTPDHVKARCLEFLASDKAADYAPTPGKPFEVDRLSAAQLALCQAYFEHMTKRTESPAAEIARRLELLASRRDAA